MTQIVFVRGGKTDPAFPWMYFHFDPWKDVKPKPAPVSLVYFDYPEGKRKTWKNWVPKHGKAAPRDPDAEEDLAPKIKIRLLDHSIDTGPEKPSVLALYDWVKRQPRESISALHVFSHAWPNGPVIWVDSYENRSSEDLNADRDPNDSEFRRRDFFGRNPLADAEGRRFTAALAPNALIKFWGCNEGLHWEGDAPRSNSTGMPLRKMILEFMKISKGAEGKAARGIILASYLEWIRASFQFTVASELGIPIWAGPLGWGSTPWDNDELPDRSTRILHYKGSFPPDLTTERWWRVSAHFTGQFRKFFRNTLKARIDATGYVEYKQSWFDDARKMSAGAETDLIKTPRDLQQQLLDRIAQLGSTEA